MTLLPRSSSGSPNNRRVRALPAALLLAAAVIGGAAGCRSTAPAAPSATVPTPPAESPAPPRVAAYVRLGTLVARHPLWADMERLSVARERLASLVPGFPLADRALTDPYVLPPLSGVQSSGGLAAVRAALLADRVRARARLAAQATDQLGAFLDALQSRQDLLIAQRRAEKEAAALSSEQREARQIRDDEAAAVRAKIAARSPDVVNRQLPVIVLGAQMAPGQQVIQPDPTLRVPNPPPVVLMPPVLDQKALDADIAKLEADPKTAGVSLRARFTLNLRSARQRLRAIRAEIDAILANGDKAINARVAAMEESHLNAIEAELESLRQDTEGMFLVRAQRAALERALGDEAAVAARTSAESDLSGPAAGHSAAGAAEFVSLFGGGQGAVGPAFSALGVHAALQRVNEQQMHLKQFVLADVRDAVRDAAETHRVNVSFAPAAGRQDMTEQFARWIGLTGSPGGPQRPAMETARGRQKE